MLHTVDLTMAILYAAQSVDSLRAALAAAGPTEAIILMPLVGQAQSILNTLEQLKSALREAAQ